MIAAAEAPRRNANRVAAGTMAALGLYSLAIITIEARSTQDAVRHYLSDVSEEGPLFAINTTLSVTLLWSAALLFAVAAQLPRSAASRELRRWLWSQAAVFFYLGCDDRCLLHETMSRLFGVGDHYFLLTVAIIELGLLAYGWRSGLLPVAAARCLVPAAALFAGMWAIDAFAAHDLRLRLSVEDLCKTWSCFFFASFAWKTLFFYIDVNLSPVHQGESGFFPGRLSLHTEIET